MLAGIELGIETSVLTQRPPKTISRIDRQVERPSIAAGLKTTILW